MATEKTRQSRKQHTHINETKTYSVTYADMDNRLNVYFVLAAALTIITLVFAVSELPDTIQFFGSPIGVSVLIVIVGLFIESENYRLLKIIARDYYARQQESDNDSDFKNYLPIKKSKLSILPIWILTVLSLGLLITISSVISQSVRANIDTTGVERKYDSLTDERNKLGNNMILTENRRLYLNDSLSKLLSLCEQKTVNLRSDFGKRDNRDSYAQAKYLKPDLNKYAAEKSSILQKIRDINAPISKVKSDQIKALDQQILDLKKDKDKKEADSKETKWDLIGVHILFMFLSLGSVTYVAFQRVKYDLLCGKGFVLEEIKEEITPSVTDTPKTVIMKEALETVKLKRRGSRGKEKEEVSLSDYLGWKNDEQYHRRYREVNNQLKQNYTFISGEDGIDRVCPIIKKK
jgi:hypothetical protein